MRIAFINNFSPSLVNFHGPLLETLAGSGHEILALGPEEHGPTRRWLQARGVAFETYPLEPTGLRPHRELLTLASLYLRLRRYRAEMVFCNTVKPVIYGSLAAAGAGTPAIHSAILGLASYTNESQSGWRSRLVHRLQKKLYRLSLSFNRQVYFYNPDDKALFIREGLLSQATTPQLLDGVGVCLERFPQAAPVERPHFLLIARLLRQKGIVEYAAAARQLKAHRPETRFSLVGPWEPHPDAIDPEDLKRWEDEGLLKWHGEVQDVRPFLADCSAYVLPSYREGLPRTVLEAMATGRAIITTHAPGCRETVRDGYNGFLVPKAAAKPLAEAMETMVQQPALCRAMGQRSRQMAEERFCVEQVNQRLLRSLGRSRGE